MPSVLREPPFLLFEDHLAGAAVPMARLYHRPQRVLEARRVEEVGGVLAAADRARAQGFHVAGFLSYEAAAAFEPGLAATLAMPVAGDPPLAWFAIFDEVRLLSRAEREELFDEAAAGTSRPACLSGRTTTLDEERYLHHFTAIREALAAGEIYQINFTFPLEWCFEGDPVAFYRRLADAQPVSYAAFLDTGTHRILSLSPELFVAGQGRHLLVRPMKGTAARGRDPLSDRRIAGTLVRDPKSRAENLMIVDLLRNDLSRLACRGGVRVAELFTLERYPSLFQMTSTVIAECREPPRLSALMAALFPCGSVTGAPKLRAMEWIARLEGHARGIYTGAIGFAEPDGHDETAKGGGARLRFNVAIRTLLLDRQGRARMGVGSGIVADSRARDEYAECMLKAAFVEDAPAARQAFDLVETFRHEPGEGWRRLDAHLCRMQRSAAHFGFAFPEREIVARLEACARRLAGSDRPQRVRLLLAREGRVAVSARPLETITQPVPVVPWPAPLAVDDPRAAHKTSDRRALEAALREARARHGAHEVLFYDSDGGWLREGAWTTLFLEIGGRLFTPPLSAGILPGVLRAELIRRRSAQVVRLTLDDLARAEALWIGNSLRGLMRARLCGRQTP